MANSTSVRLKLLIDTRAERVLFAEVDKDFVDFLFHIPPLPVAKLISLVGKESMAGSLGKLYQSIENMKESYILPNKSKDALLKPVPPPISGAYMNVPLLGINDYASPSSSSSSSSSAGVTKKFYACSTCSNGYGTHRYASDGPGAVCPYCNRTMTSTNIVNYVAPTNTATPKKESCNEESGFVKGLVTYMVMDDLVVTPLSTVSSITLLNKYNVIQVGALEEKVVNMGMNEAVKLLKASLETDKVLTSVFLKGKRPATTDPDPA